MVLARNRNLGVRTENQATIQILHVHRVEKWGSRIEPRRIQHFEEGPMRLVVWFGIAGSLPESHAYPWFHLCQDFRLPPAFEVERVSALPLRSPAARLHGSPRQQIDRAGVTRDGMDAVASIGIDAYVFGVAPPHGRRTVVHLQDA